MMTDVAVTFAVSLLALLTAHHVADHWVQTSCQAAGKAQRNWYGVWCCAKHVAGYTLTTAALVALVWGVFGLAISLVGFVTGQLISAVTHYWSDRRYTLAWLARVLGKAGYYDHGGSFELDQSFHRLMLFAAALATALI
ncbi:transcriptional regulator [Bounagaea algeriensis]